MTEKREHRYGLTLANRITIARILCVPVFILLLMYYVVGAADGSEPNWVIRWAAMVVFLGTALSDALDGYLARTRNEVTRLGTLLDPLADKALLLSAIIVLGRPSATVFEPNIPIWFFLLVVSRDVVLILGALIIHHMAGDVVVRPRVTGKLATVSQMLLIVWVLAKLGTSGFAWVLGAASFFTAVSGILYVADGIRQLEKA
ncbi:MAG: CDP-alcohol phosphatidyltransferase family protein [Kiritimatiellae bacterium]|nr:CDP-alcohol phosphatidyltransferase family protein [Kiritimatiellia bacterium]